MAKKLGFLLVLVILNWVCLSAQIIIEKVEGFSNEELSSNKIILINPHFNKYSIVENVEEDYFNKEKNQLVFEKALKNTLNKLKNINIEIETDRNNSSIDTDYYNYLLKLNENIIFVNNFQDHPFNNNESKLLMPRYQEKVFVQTPRLQPVFSELISKYNTRYYAIYGIISVDASKRKSGVNTNFDGFINFGKASFSYLIIVNVEKGEIIYREYKKMHFNMKRKYLLTTVYNTFYSLNKKIQ